MIADQTRSWSDRNPDDCAVYTKGVHKAYRRGAAATPVLEGIDLAVDRGRCVYLAGPSGSGKTTLLSILGCILSADQGTVRILGEDVGSIGRDERTTLRRTRLGFVFQRFHLIRGLNAINNVCVPLVLQGLTRPKAQVRAMALLEAVGLADRAGVDPRNLSAGQCQRVALARALAGDPELILADEPTASLDAANGQEVMALLKRLTVEQGKTAVVVTHDPRIFHFADRILHLENGRIMDRAEQPAAAMAAAGG